LKERFSTDIYPAALAIALHNFSTYKNDSEIPKIYLEEMPIPFLLIYCDTVQDWGRPAKDKITINFENLTISENEVLAEVSVKNCVDYDEKKKDYERVFAKIRSEKICFALKLMCEETGNDSTFRTKKNKK
jgi:hypothetical protein